MVRFSHGCPPESRFTTSEELTIQVPELRFRCSEAANEEAENARQTKRKGAKKRALQRMPRCGQTLPRCGPRNCHWSGRLDLNQRPPEPHSAGRKSRQRRYSVSDRRGSPRRFRWRNFSGFRSPESSAGTGPCARRRGLREDYGAAKGAESMVSYWADQREFHPGSRIVDQEVVPIAVGWPARGLKRLIQTA